MFTTLDRDLFLPADPDNLLASRRFPHATHNHGRASGNCCIAPERGMDRPPAGG